MTMISYSKHRSRSWCQNMMIFEFGSNALLTSIMSASTEFARDRNVDTADDSRRPPAFILLIDMRGLGGTECFINESVTDPRIDESTLELNAIAAFTWYFAGVFRRCRRSLASSDWFKR